MNKVGIRRIFLLVSLCACSFAGCLRYPANYGYPGYSEYSASKVQKLQLCVKYEAQYGWSSGYSVQANVMNGSILNQKTGTFNYNALSTYVVVFWDQGEASIIELSYFFGSFSVVGIEGTDQYGRKWQVAQSDYCF